MQVVIVGGGAAGCIAAGAAGRQGHAVTVVERNARPARKVMITGKGRCNVTNDCSVADFLPHVRRGGRFLYSALTAFSPADTMALLEALGVPLKTERGNRVFPCSDKAVDVVDALVKYAKDGGARFRQGRVIRLLTDHDRCIGVELEDGVQIPADAVVVATGGASYPGTGSTGDGYTLALQAGHTVHPPRPALSALESPEAFCVELQGLSLKNCGLTVEDTATHKTVYADQGEMLFTHFGVSGPMILSASSVLDKMAPGRYRLHIHWKPALTPEQLDARILRDLEERRNQDLENGLGKLLPRVLIPVMLRLAEIPATRKCHSVTREERRRLAERIQDMPVEIAGFRPLAEAIVTAGGVELREIDPRTMASKKMPGLYFAGEVLDADACTGGFNLQIAFSTGMAAGTHISI